MDKPLGPRSRKYQVSLNKSPVIFERVVFLTVSCGGISSFRLVNVLVTRRLPREDLPGVAVANVLLCGLVPSHYWFVFF